MNKQRRKDDGPPKIGAYPLLGSWRGVWLMDGGRDTYYEFAVVDDYGDLVPAEERQLVISLRECGWFRATPFTPDPQKGNQS